ncbi:hypothetical protein HDU76_004264 [Blyttiomyces sp. JEL0837]|nr:hypothetical protein HDU76_004264 [Blyttiomyces sp. JEL0837]
MTSSNLEVWLTGFGSMYVKKKDVNGRLGQTLWHTHTNVQRTTDTVTSTGAIYNNGSSRLLIDDMGHILIQVDNMFNNVGVTPYNYTYYDSNTRQTITDKFVTVWSNVPKHMMYQVGVKKAGYTFVLEEFPATPGQNWNLVLYDGGGSKVWCATSVNCNWAGSTGYRFPRNYLLPTDYPTDAVEQVQDGITSHNGRFKLILDWSGNLIFKDGVRTMWETLSSNLSFAQPPYTLALSNRGSLYVSDKWGGLIVNTILENNIVRNSVLNITDQGELQVFGFDGRQLWTSYDLINPGMSGWRTWNDRKTFCYPGCRTCLPKQPTTITRLYSNGSDFTPFAGYLKAGQSLLPVSGSDSLIVTNTSIYIGNCPVFETDSSKLVQGMILSISGTGRLSYIDANSTTALWQIGTFYTGVEPFTLTVEDSFLLIRDSTGAVTTNYSCPNAPGHVVIHGTDISGFDIADAAQPFTSMPACSQACEANPKCDWWNANPVYGCYLKETDKSNPNVYTWFMNTNGAIVGDITKHDMASNLQPTQDLFPQDCYNKCANTPGCHWVNFFYTKYNGKVSCYLKQADAAVASTSTGIPNNHGRETLCSGNAQYRALNGVDVAGVGDVGSVDNVISACYMKQTTREPAIYTWFIHSNGPLAGDIPGFDILASPITSPSPQACLSTCINTANCHWVNFKFNADRSVTCWPKQGTISENTVLGYAGVGGYTSFNGYNLPGTFAVDGTGALTAASLRECSRLCSADIRCGWSIFVSATKKCYLNAPPKSQSPVITQFRESLSSIPGDIYGFDITPSYVSPSVSSCQAKCSSTSKCQWFNFDSSYATSKTVASCYLKQVWDTKNK